MFHVEPLASVSEWICGTKTPTAESTGTAFFVSFFMIGVLVSFALVVLLARSWHGYLRAKRCSRHCDECGYDLRITPDPHGPLHTRCPECGNLNPNRTRPITVARELRARLD